MIHKIIWNVHPRNTFKRSLLITLRIQYIKFDEFKSFARAILRVGMIQVRRGVSVVLVHIRTWSVSWSLSGIRVQSVACLPVYLALQHQSHRSVQWHNVLFRVAVIHLKNNVLLIMLMRYYSMILYYGEIPLWWCTITYISCNVTYHYITYKLLNNLKCFYVVSSAKKL